MKTLYRYCTLLIWMLFIANGIIAQQDNPAISDNEIGDPSWGFKLTKPAGWIHKQTVDGAVLGHNTVPGMIIIMVHNAENMDQVKKDMSEGVQDEWSNLMPSTGLQAAGENMLTADYSGMMEGTDVKAKGIGILSPYGGGAYIIAVTTPESMNKELVAAAESLAESITYFKSDVGALMKHFAGNWTNHSGNVSNYIFLGPDGSYSDQYEASYSGDFTDSEGNYTGGWNTMSEDQSKGRWTVRGNKTTGTIVVKLNNGGEILYKYHVHQEDGYTYYNEYWFNNSHYAKNKE